MKRPGTSNRIKKDASNRAGEGKKEAGQETRSRPELYFRHGAERHSFTCCCGDLNLKEPVNPLLCRQYSSWAAGNKGDESESILGKWFAKSGKRKDVILATKVGLEMGVGKKGLKAAYILSLIHI